MKSFIAVCVVAVAIATFTIPAKAQSVSLNPPATSLPTSELSSKVPGSPNPHGDCDCDKTCKAVQHSQVPYKKNPADAAKYLSYESYPVLCRDAAATYLAPSAVKSSKKYICKQTFDCCRKCNHMFYTCLVDKREKQPFGACMRAAYKCMCYCIDEKSNEELPYKKKAE